MAKECRCGILLENILIELYNTWTDDYNSFGDWLCLEIGFTEEEVQDFLSRQNLEDIDKDDSKDDSIRRKINIALLKIRCNLVSFNKTDKGDGNVVFTFEFTQDIGFGRIKYVLSYDRDWLCSMTQDELNLLVECKVREQISK